LIVFLKALDNFMYFRTMDFQKAAKRLKKDVGFIPVPTFLNQQAHLLMKKGGRPSATNPGSDGAGQPRWRHHISMKFDGKAIAKNSPAAWPIDLMPFKYDR